MRWSQRWLEGTALRFSTEGDTIRISFRRLRNCAAIAMATYLPWAEGVLTLWSTHPPTLRARRGGWQRFWIGGSSTTRSSPVFLLMRDFRQDARTMRPHPWPKETMAT